MEELENKNEDEDLLEFNLDNTLKLTDIDEYQEINDIAKNSLFKIYNDNGVEGTGFFCEIPDPENEDKNIDVLLTCNHVFPINKDNLNNYKNIKYKKINEENVESLNLEGGRRIWVNKEIDYTCIEIFPKTNIF